MHLKLSSSASVAITRVDEVLDLGDHAGGLTHPSKARMMVSKTNFMNISTVLPIVRSYLPIVHCASGGTGSCSTSCVFRELTHPLLATIDDDTRRL